MPGLDGVSRWIATVVLGESIFSERHRTSEQRKIAGRSKRAPQKVRANTKKIGFMSKGLVWSSV